jgi:hypothetical protein
VKVLGVSLKIPNSSARVRALRFHDLHHVLTGYDTDFAGEAAIGAWELASGCAGFPAAVVLNLGSVLFGIFTGPGPILEAFARGRTTRNLYGEGRFDDALLARTVGDLRRELGLCRPRRAPQLADAIGLAFMWLGASMLLLFATSIVLGALLALAALAWRAFARG